MVGGGRVLPGLRKRSITPLNAFLEQQTGSHMKAEVFSYPIEVAEVEIAASEGRRSGQGPGEKKFDQKF